MRRLALSVTLAAMAAMLALPAGALAEGSISALSVDRSSVRGGATSTGTVTLASPTRATRPSCCSAATRRLRRCRRR